MITTMDPPKSKRGRPRRMSAEDIRTLASDVLAGKFVSDGTTAKKSTAAQRGRAAIKAIKEDGYVGPELHVKTWVAEGDQYHWAIGVKGAK